MKSEKELLDKFGKILVKKCFDQILERLYHYRNLEESKIKYAQLIQSLSEKEFSVLEDYITDNAKSSLFDFMSIFEEEFDFKLMYREGSDLVDLLEISDSLRAEPIIDDGWIARFSKKDNFTT